MISNLDKSLISPLRRMSVFYVHHAYYKSHFMLCDHRLEKEGTPLTKIIHPISPRPQEQDVTIKNSRVAK
jgi:hypothetical protein